MSKHANSLSRRTVLRGMGATIALPFLEIMGGKTSAAAAGKKEPSRLACFYIPGCINHYNWFPEDTGFDYKIAPSHKPLAHHRERFSVLTKLSHIEGRISGHPHAYNWLTGHNININPGAHSNTISMDQVAAQHICPTYVPSLQLSFADGVGTTTLSRNALGVDLPATKNYRSVFERLFPPADKSQLKDAQARIELNRSVLDTAVGDVKAFRNKLGRLDQRRLDQYLDSVREVEQRLNEREQIVKRGRPKFDENGVKLEPELGSNHMREHIEMMFDMIALAFQTDMTRVVTQSLGWGGRAQLRRLQRLVQEGWCTIARRPRLPPQRFGQSRGGQSRHQGDRLSGPNVLRELGSFDGQATCDRSQ